MDRTGLNRQGVRTVEVGTPVPANVGLRNGHWVDFLDTGLGAEMS